MLRRNLPAVRAVATGSTILLMVLACQKAPVSDPTASPPASKAGAPEVLPPEPHLVPGQFDVQTAHFPQQAEELTGSGTGKKEAAKDVAKEAAQEAVKEAVKEASKEAAKEALQPKPLPPNLRSVHLNPQAEGGPTAPQETAAASLVQAGLKVLPKSEGMALALVLPSLVSMGFLDKAQAGRMEKLLNAEYGAMAKVPEFAALESTFDLSAQSLTNDMTPVRPDHFFVLLPDNYDAKQRYPVLLFLHGQSMNFQAYVWAFYKNAGHNDWIILFPTIEGWRERQSEWTAFYKRLFEWAQTNYLVDTSRFAVVGHSAGCFDAMRLALHHPQLVKSMVLLAGHWRPGASDVYDALWPSLGTHDIMVHCAENDTLVPMEACRELHRQITIRGNAARFAVGQEMDHFSVLESGSGLHKFVLQWLATR